MDPLSIALALLAAWGVSKLLAADKPTGFPVVIPPAAPWPDAPVDAPCPQNPPRPSDLIVMVPPYPEGVTAAALSAWGYKQLKYPKGTLVIDTLADQLVVARLEYHYHPPGTPHVTATGCHKGATLYRPTMPWVQIGSGPPVPALSSSS